jgi:methionyl-tRNA formyltransferase
MHINEGIDTGNIIHQIRAKICMNDTPHSIGNRLIIETAETCKMIINRFDNLLEIEQPICYENKYYKTKDFNNDAVERLYRNLDDGLLNHYVNKVKSGFEFFKILENPGFKI